MQKVGWEVQSHLVAFDMDSNVHFKDALLPEIADNYFSLVPLCLMDVPILRKDRNFKLTSGKKISFRFLIRWRAHISVDFYPFQRILCKFTYMISFYQSIN